MPKDWKEATHRVRLASIADKVPEPLRSALKEAAFEEEFIKRRPVLAILDNELSPEEVTKGLTGVKPGERAVLRYVSTRDVDRDNEVLDPAGAILDQFLLAPQVLWAHDYTGPPTGKAEWIYPNDYGLRSKTVYAETLRAEEIWQLIKGEFLSTASVGFMPVKRVFRGDPEWNATVQKYNQKWSTDLEKAGCEVITTKWVLLEYSDVPVPANPNALITAIAKGEVVVGRSLSEQLGLPDPEETTATEEGKPAEKAVEVEPVPTGVTEEPETRVEPEPVVPGVPVLRRAKPDDIKIGVSVESVASDEIPPLLLKKSDVIVPVILRAYKPSPTREEIAAQAAQDALNQLRGKV